MPRLPKPPAALPIRTTDDLHPRSALLSMFEARALWEFGASRTDGSVAWPCSSNEHGAQVENIEVHASPVGMGIDPLARHAIADRLAQPAGPWPPFDPSGTRRWFFQTGVGPASPASA